jgi:hypothetical protein
MCCPARVPTRHIQRAVLSGRLEYLPVYAFDFYGAFAQDGAAQVGATQDGAAQDGAAQVGVAQVGATQVGVAQVGVAQVGAAQVGATQVGAAQDGAEVLAKSIADFNAIVGDRFTKTLKQAREYTPSLPGVDWKAWWPGKK